MQARYCKGNIDRVADDLDGGGDRGGMSGNLAADRDVTYLRSRSSAGRNPGELLANVMGVPPALPGWQ